MDSTFQRRLLDSFMSDYQRIYLVDLIKNEIYMQVNNGQADEDTFPWMEAVIDPTVSFEKFTHYYSEYSIEESRREWFEMQMNAENIRTTLLGRNSFSISCPLVTGEWRRIEVRRFDDESGIAKTALICIPAYGKEKEFEKGLSPFGKRSGHETGQPASEKDSEYETEESLFGKDSEFGKESGFGTDPEFGAGKFTSYNVREYGTGQYETGNSPVLNAGRSAVSDSRTITLLGGSITTCEVDVTDYRLLRGRIYAPDIFYPRSIFKAPGDFANPAEVWCSHIISGNRDEVKMLVSQDYMLQCYEMGDWEPWIEYMVRDRFGNEVWLNQKMLLKKSQKTGHVLCLIVLRDITNQMTMRIENERRLSMIESLTAEYSSVYLVDLLKDKYYIYRLADFIRKRLEEDYKDTFDRTVKSYAEHGVYTLDRESFKSMLLAEGIRKNLRGRRVYSFIYRAVTDHDPKYYRCMVARLDKGNREAEEVLIGFADVHEEQEYAMRQKQLLEDALEQARAAGKAKTVFLSNMSHDIRTPMNAIIGFAELAKLHIDDGETVEDSLDKILSSGEHLLQLINNILDLSRVESGRLVLKEEPCALRESIDELLIVISPQVSARNLTFSKTIDEDVPDKIYCDVLKIRQLIINLVTNAIKYTPPGGHIQLRIAKAGAPEGYAGIIIRVIDDGIGMSPEFMGKLFDPFEREESSVVSKTTGSGLGMTICKSIVNAMGGTITARSKQNEGTEITVQLEFRLQDGDHKEERDTGIPVAEPGRYRFFNRPVFKHVSKSKVRILLVEDNRMNREIADRMLKHLGYEAVMSDTGDQAVRIIREAPDQEYDLILMDVHMPGMNGYEATGQIRSLGGARAWIPVVAMTADAFESDIQQASRAKMNAFISKPVNLQTLKTVIERFVGSPEDGKV